MTRHIGRAIVALRLEEELTVAELASYFDTNPIIWHKIENEYTDSPQLHDIYTRLLLAIQQGVFKKATEA